jgi:hypothetical protein
LGILSFPEWSKITDIFLLVDRRVKHLLLVGSTLYVSDTERVTSVAFKYWTADSGESNARRSRPANLTSRFRCRHALEPVK